MRIIGYIFALALLVIGVESPELVLPGAVLFGFALIASAVQQPGDISGGLRLRILEACCASDEGLDKIDIFGEVNRQGRQPVLWAILEAALHAMLCNGELRMRMHRDEDDEEDEEDKPTVLYVVADALRAEARNATESTEATPRSGE